MHWAAKAVVATIGLEVVGAAWRFTERRRLFELAKARAKATGRTFMVVGDPNAGATTKFLQAYGCGDVTVDLHGAPGCPGGLQADITKKLPFPDDSCVVFVACTLEYVEDGPAAVRELERLAGVPSNLFVVTVSPFFPVAFWVFGGKWWVQGPPFYPKLSVERLNNPIRGEGRPLGEAEAFPAMAPQLYRSRQ